MLITPLVALTLAATPTLTPALPCFSVETGVEVVGTGWTPNAQVRLTSSVNGETVRTDTVTADLNGNLTFNPGAATGGATRERIDLAGQDLTHPELQATTRFTLSWFGPFFAPWNTNGPARGRPGKVGTIEASGYLDEIGQSLYAHYTLKGEQMGTVRVGKLKAPCGQLKKRFRQFPFKRVRRGTYSVYFDTMPFAGDSTFDSPGYRRVVVR